MHTIFQQRLAYACLISAAFAGIAQAAPFNSFQGSWAMGCTIRSEVDGDAALNVLGGGASEYQPVVIYPSSGDASPNQQWNIIPDSADPTLWYLSPVSSSQSNPLCLTVQNAVGQKTYLDYCSIASVLQEFRFGIAYAKVRYEYHILPAAAVKGSLSWGLIPAGYADAAGTSVQLAALYGTNLSGVDPSLVTQPGEVWAIQNCSDIAGNPITFGSGWTIFGQTTGY